MVFFTNENKDIDYRVVEEKETWERRSVIVRTFFLVAVISQSVQVYRRKSLIIKLKVPRRRGTDNERRRPSTTVTITIVGH